MITFVYIFSINIIRFWTYNFIGKKPMHLTLAKWAHQIGPRFDMILDNHNLQ